MSLALTGTGAPAGKMLQAAIETLARRHQRQGRAARPPGRDHRLRRPEQPLGCAGHLHQAHLGGQSRSAGRSLWHQLCRAGDADDHPEQEDADQLHRDRHQRSVSLRQILLDGAGRLGRRERLLQGLLRDGGEAESQAADRRDHRRRRRIRPGGRRRRPPGAEEERLQADLRQELSAEHHRLHAGDARGAGRQCRHRLCRRLSGRQRRPRARRQRDRTDAENLRRRADRPARDADQGAARPDAERHRHPRELRAVAEAQLPRSRRPDEALPGQGRRVEDRSDRLRLRAVRLCERANPRSGGHRDQKSRPRRARQIHPWPQLQDRGRRTGVRQGRRMVEAADGADPVPEHPAQQRRINSRPAIINRSCGRRSTRPAR